MQQTAVEVRDLKVQDIMTKSPVTIQPSESLISAWHAMNSHDIKHLPVVENNQLCGILSDRDILCELHFQENIGHLKPTTVDYAMNPDVITVKSHQPISDAVQQMMQNKIHCIVVVDDHGHTSGIVTDFDLLKLMNNILT